MKKIKKIVSIILILVLTILPFIPIVNVDAEELVITTYGENEDGINPNLVTNTAELTVAGMDNEDKFAAYKIIDVFYDESTNEITYEFTSNFQAFLDQSTNETYKNMTIEDYFNLTSDEVNDSCTNCTSVITTSTLNALVSNYTTYIRKNSNVGLDMSTGYNSNVISSNYYAKATVAAGAYLILPTNIIQTNVTGDSSFGFTRNLYGVMVGNVVFTVNETTLEWELNNQKIYAKNTSNELRTSLGGFSFSEFFGVMDGTINIEGVDTNFYQNISSSISKKSVYYFEIGKTQFPTNAVNKTYKVQITLPSGISFDSSKIYNMNGEEITEISENKIIDKDNGNLLGTISINGQIINVDFNLTNLESMDFSHVCLGFDVWLNETAIVGTDGNEITAVLTTTDDPYVEGSVTTVETTNTIYTYGLELTSFNNDNTAQLKGAKYEVYTSEDLAADSLIGEFEVGEDGTGTFAGVAEGTVYLKQTKAPTGYQLIKDVIPVKIAIEESNDTDNDYYYEVTTNNQRMWFLPSTGGIGTIIYTVIGLVIIGVASIFLVKYRKKTVTM